MRWQPSDSSRPHWWQLQFGLIDASVFLRGDRYEAFVGRGIYLKSAQFPTLGVAKKWAVKELRSTLNQSKKQIQPEIPWLLWGCLAGAIALHAIWVMLFTIGS